MTTRPAEPTARHPGHHATTIALALLAVEREARAYAAMTHGNLAGSAYRAREEARERLLDALSVLDEARAKDTR